MIYLHLKDQLAMLGELLEKLTDEQFQTPIEVLSGASIGGHTRHIIEVMNCLVNAPTSGEVNYIHRERNFILEQNKVASKQAIIDAVACAFHKDTQIELIGEDKHRIATNYPREIAYISDHTLHHLALIKVGLHALQCADLVDERFGVASATLNFRASMLSEE